MLNQLILVLVFSLEGADQLSGRTAVSVVEEGERFSLMVDGGPSKHFLRLSWKENIMA